MRARLRAWAAGTDRGSMLPAVAAMCAALLMSLGLVYDGALKIRAAREATTIAGEAARAAGQEIQASSILGATPGIEASRGAAAAQSYLTQAGASGSVSVTGDSVTVTANTTWTPRFYGLLLGDGTETGTATTSTVRVLGGIEQ